MKTVTIRQLRIKLGWTQIHLGSKCKVRQCTVSAWECNFAMPKPKYRKILDKIAEGVGYEINYCDEDKD